MKTFHEWRAINFLTQELQVPKSVATQFVMENYLTDFVQRAARKYMLPAAVVMAIISGQGCKDQSCPTPQTQQQIKQDLDQEVKSYTSPDAGRFLPDQPIPSADAKKFLPDQPQQFKQVAPGIYQNGTRYNVEITIPYSSLADKMRSGGNQERLKQAAIKKLLRYLGQKNLTISQASIQPGSIEINGNQISGVLDVQLGETNLAD